MQPEQEQQPPANNDYQPRPADVPQQPIQPQPAPEFTPQQPAAQPEPAQLYVPQSQTQEPAPAFTPTQTQPAPEYTPQQPAAPQHPAEDPGKVFSILGIVAAFIFMQLPGLILSIIGYKKSKKAGFKTTLGTIGIWLNAVGLVLTLATIALFTWAAYQGVQQNALDSSRASTAMSIMKKAEVYSVMNSSEGAVYPTIEQLRSASSDAALTSEERTKLKDTDQPTGDDIGYKTCGGASGNPMGATVYVYSESEQKAIEHGSIGDCITTSAN